MWNSSTSYSCQISGGVIKRDINTHLQTFTGESSGPVEEMWLRICWLSLLPWCSVCCMLSTGGGHENVAQLSSVGFVKELPLIVSPFFFVFFFSSFLAFTFKHTVIPPSCTSSAQLTSPHPFSPSDGDRGAALILFMQSPLFWSDRPGIDMQY